MSWRILDTGIQTAEEIMGFDAALLDNADHYDSPILHFYEWKGDCATYGYFADPAALLNLEKVAQRSLSLARRPTGGGMIFHLWDMAFSVLVPAHCAEFSTNTLENYAFINRAVLSSIQEFSEGQIPLSLTPEDYSPWDRNCLHFCMATPTKYDVMWEQKKVAGAAQRKTKKGFLHQGSIALVMPSLEYLEDILLPGTRVKEAMQTFTCPLLGKSASLVEMADAKLRLRELLATHLCRASLISSKS